MSLVNRPLIKSENVLIKVPKRTPTNNQNVFVFPDDQELRNKKLLWISFYSSEQIAKTPNGQPLVTFNFINNAYLVLESYSGVQFVYNQPVQDYINLLGAGPTQFYPIQFKGQRVNWPKSYIQINDATIVSDTEDQFIMAQVGYYSSDEAEMKALDVEFKNKY
jgi:hypothetical protein